MHFLLTFRLPLRTIPGWYVLYALRNKVCLWEIKPLQKIWNRLERRGEDGGNTEQRLWCRNKLAMFWGWLRWRRRVKEVVKLKLKGGGNERRMWKSRRGPGIWWNEKKVDTEDSWLGKKCITVARQKGLTGKRPSEGGWGHPAKPRWQGDWNGLRKSKSILSHWDKMPVSPQTTEEEGGSKAPWSFQSGK